MSRVPLASAEVKFRRSGHGSRAMPNNSKWYSMMIVVILIFGIVHIVVTYCVVIGLDEAT